MKEKRPFLSAGKALGHRVFLPAATVYGDGTHVRLAIEKLSEDVIKALNEKLPEALAVREVSEQPGHGFVLEVTIQVVKLTPENSPPPPAAP